MANETILVVDDAPVNLKLTDLLLRKEGFQVHATSDAEQALTLLRSLHPDLILVDIQLPGMSGLELTRRIKQDSKTRDIVVVALTACAMKGDDNLAFAAGCDGYITKPIETLTLGRKVREYLAARHAVPPSKAPEPALLSEPAPAAPALEPSRSEISHGLPGGLVLAPAELEELRRRFLETGVLQYRELLDDLDRNFDLQGAIRMVNGWQEAAWVLEYADLAVLASDTEKLLRAPRPDRGTLSEALSNLMVGFVEPPEATLGPVPQEISKVLTGKSVALVGCSPEEAERLCGALERAGAKPRLYDADSSSEADSVNGCSVMLLHVRPETLGKHWLHPVTIAGLKQPVVLIGFRDLILELEESVPARASDMLIDGWQPEEALLRVTHALLRQGAVPRMTPAAVQTSVPAIGTIVPREINRDAEVLIADDDMTFRMLVRSSIQGAGIKCRMACNGQEALQMIRDCKPPAAILDVNMPLMDGYEVLAAVRAEKLPVRVILLTARQHESDITRGFTLGADDYIVKPFNPPELIARLKRFLWQ